MDRFDFSDGTSVRLEITDDDILECHWSNGGVTVISVRALREMIRDSVEEILKQLRDDTVKVRKKKEYKTIYRG